MALGPSVDDATRHRHLRKFSASHLSRLSARYEKTFSITTADSLLKCDAENFFHAVKNVAAPPVPMAIKHPQQCFRVVSRTLKHFSGCFMATRFDPQLAVPQAGITGRVRLPPMQTFHAFFQSTASQVEGCSSLFVLNYCHDCCCIAWSASPATSEHHMD